ncbi:MAG: hypothetical protein ACR2K0_05765 [Acidimicrobiales bacterium]
MNRGRARAVQSVFTVIAPVRSDRVGDVERVLAEVSADVEGNRHLPLARLGGLHFASLVLFPASRGFPPTLVFESNVDATIADHLADLVAAAGPGVDAIWGGCTDYPAGGSGDPAAVRHWLRSRVVLPGAYHIGATGRSREQITAEASLQEVLERFLDEQQAAASLPEASAEVRAALQARVRDDPSLAEVARPAPAEGRRDRLRRLLHLAGSADSGVLVPVGALLVVLVALARRRPLAAVAVVAAGPAWLRWREISDPAVDHAVDPAALTAIEAVEDQPGVMQNHLASLTEVKPGVARSTLLRSILWVINVGARTKYTKGELGGIPSIHFAHWSVIDGGRRLLFLSNYGGSWESYLDDFIEKAASGLSAVWSHTVDFPASRWLGLQSGGARNGPAFKRVARRSQVATTVHYRAYPERSVANINDTSALVADLFTDLDGDEVQRWLLRF